MIGWIAEAWARMRARPAPLDLPGVEFHDRRKFAAQKHHGYKTRARSIKKVTGACLHQTGCWLGEDPERYDGMGAHIGVTRGRKVIWLHDWDRWVCAANGWNNATISIEVDGLYAGIDGDPRTVWDNPATPIRETGMDYPPDLAATVADAIVWATEDARRRGAPMRVLVAHRQSSAMRPADPGQLPWRESAIPARARCGLVTPDAFTLDDGRRIPTEWDPRSPWRY